MSQTGMLVDGNLIHRPKRIEGIPVLRTFLTATAVSVLCCVTASAQEKYLDRITSTAQIIEALKPKKDSRRTFKIRRPNVRPAAVLREISFERNGADLTGDSKRQLDFVGNALLSEHLNGKKFRIESHTSSKGRASDNRKLSEQRAKNIVSYLSDNYPRLSDRLEAIGVGEDQPLDSDHTDSNVNQRIAIANLGD